ncbi:MAG: sulfatase-like hydrolase/transferase, partial [Planctomycetota bacterium]
MRGSCIKFVVLLIGLCLSSSADARKPNVIVILTDDQGTIDTNLYGAKDLKTPHMDSLALSGVRFTQFYSGAPVCSPSRAALLTGCNPHRAGVPGNVPRRSDTAGLPPEQMTIAEMLKSNGYATALIGKWHLGHHATRQPNAQGFDNAFGHLGGCIDNYSHFFYWNGPNEHDLYRNGIETFAQGEFFGDLMINEAQEFIEKNKSNPFFIYFAINMPHYPYQGDTKWLEQYKDVPYPRNLYAAFVSTIDDRIGRLLSCLEEHQLRDDTMIIFQSDHGHSEEVRAHNGGGSAGPYRGAKFSLYEGGIRVPAFISWPGQIPAGAVRKQMVHACDWMPTIASLCQVDLPKHKLDGKNISDTIKNDDALEVLAVTNAGDHAAAGRGREVTNRRLEGAGGNLRIGSGAQGVALEAGIDLGLHLGSRRDEGLPADLVHLLD